jgi:glycerophosphoryl diester phosphodiesterase
MKGTHAMLKIIGHRGAKGEAPENTIAGFEYARKLGLVGAEFDVRLSRDDVLVVIHDGTVDRTTDATGAVGDFTATELAALDARGTCLSWPEPVGVPTLAESLDVLGAFDIIQFEIKADAPERVDRIAAGIVGEIRARGLERQSLITSFDTYAVEATRRLSPELNASFIARPDDPDPIGTALRLGCTQLNLHRYRETAADLVARAHDAGLVVGGGPCDTADDLESALDRGMDTVTSDCLTALLAHLAGN